MAKTFTHHDADGDELVVQPCRTIADSLTLVATTENRDGPRAVLIIMNKDAVRELFNYLGVWLHTQ